MHAVPPDRVDLFAARRRRGSLLDDGDVELGFSAEWEALDRGDDLDAPWLVEGLLRADEALLVDAESPDRGTTEARSLARCIAFGSLHLGVCPERTCTVAVVSPNATPLWPLASLDGRRHVPRPVYPIVSRPLLDREQDRFAVARWLRRLAVEVAIFDPAGFADRHLSRVEREHHLVLAAEACLLVGATPVFVLLRDESSWE